MAIPARQKPFRSEKEAWAFSAAEEFAGHLAGRWQSASRVLCGLIDCRGFVGVLLPRCTALDGEPVWTLLLRRHFGGLDHRAGPRGMHRISRRRGQRGEPLGRKPRPKWFREFGGDSHERLGPLPVVIPPGGVRVECPACRSPLLVQRPAEPASAASSAFGGVPGLRKGG